MTYQPVDECEVDDDGIPFTWPSRDEFVKWHRDQTRAAMKRAVDHERARVARIEAEWRVNEGAKYMDLARTLLGDEDVVAELAKATIRRGL